MNALLHRVHDSDLRITGRVYAWRPSRLVCALTVGTTRLGDGWVWLALAILLGAARGQYHRTLAAATVAGGVATLIFSILKRHFRRPRPCDLARHPVFQVLPPDRFSFPSGHTLNAFAICTVLGAQWPLLSPAFLIFAGAIAASRVLLGLHYVSDVLVGAALGALIGLIAAATLLGA